MFDSGGNVWTKLENITRNIYIGKISYTVTKKKKTSINKHKK